MFKALNSLDRHLWKLPRPARKAIVAPVGVFLGCIDFYGEIRRSAIPAARNGFAVAMDHVHDRPEDVPEPVRRGVRGA